MSVKSIRDRVQDAFGKGSSVDSNTAKDFLQVLLLKMQIILDRERNSLLRLFFLFALFILFSTASVAEATFGPIKITELSLITKILPLLIAINYYELVTLWASHSLLVETINNMYRLIHEPIIKNDLTFFMTSDWLFGFELFTDWIQDDYIFKKINNFIMNSIIWGIALSALLFECYAFVRCFSIFGVFDLSLWIILIFAIITLAKTVISWDYYSEIDRAL